MDPQELELTAEDDVARNLVNAVRAFTAALPGRACPHTCAPIRQFWTLWGALTDGQQAAMREAVARQGKGWPDRRLAAMAGHGPWEADKVRRGTWPADLAREFGRLEGGPAHEPTLIVAATEGWTWLVREYLEAGADPDSRDSHHTTALMYACYDRADTALASLLCAAGGGVTKRPE